MLEDGETVIFTELFHKPIEVPVGQALHQRTRIRRFNDAINDFLPGKGRKGANIDPAGLCRGFFAAYVCTRFLFHRFP